MKRHLLTVCALAALLVALGAGVASATPPARLLPQSGVPTVVSYQGQVTVDGAPYSGPGYFKFAVVDASGGTAWSNDGTVSGEPANAVSLTVTNGLFTVLLGDTGMRALEAAHFDGPQRYLRVWFSSDGSTFVLLSPDRRIAAVPYALQAANAGTLDGKHLADLPQANGTLVANLNADMLDGRHAADLAYTAGTGLALKGNQFSAKGSGYQNVLVVAKSGGDYDTITGALKSITDASDTNRYLVWVAPGVYNEQVTMKRYVDIEGAGELATRITSTALATVVGASDAELRFLTVQTTNEHYAIAVYNYMASPRLTHVTVQASGNDSCGVHNQDSSPTMTDVTVTASAVSGGLGVYNGNSSPVMTHVTITASGGTLSIGVDNGHSSPTIRGSTIRAIGGSGQRRGIWTECSAATPCTVRVDDSLIEGVTAVYGIGGVTTYIGASQLIGSIEGGGTVKCVGCYDGDYNPRSCP